MGGTQSSTLDVDIGSPNLLGKEVDMQKIMILKK